MEVVVTRIKFPVILAILGTGVLLVLQTAQAQPMRVTVDKSRSHIIAVTYRSGLLGFLGHEHAILATEWSTGICYAPDEISQSSVQITIPTESLRIDSQRARDIANLGPGPSEEEIQEIQVTMLSEENLAAAQYPRLTFESSSVSLEGDSEFILEGPITLRGQTRTVRFPVTISRVSGNEIMLSGRFEVLQTDFGIDPESVAGVVNVANNVDIVFEIVGEATDTACSP
jgi:polyisoprenoid-binding protein YceI